MGVAGIVPLAKQAFRTAVQIVEKSGPSAFLLPHLQAPDIVHAESIRKAETRGQTEEETLPIFKLRPPLPLDEGIKRKGLAVVCGGHGAQTRPFGCGERHALRPGSKKILAIHRLAFPGDFVEPKASCHGRPFSGPTPIAERSRGIEVHDIAVQRPPHPVEGPKRLVNAILQFPLCGDFVGCCQVAQIVGVEKFRFLSVANRTTEQACGLGQGDTPGVSFIVVLRVALRHLIGCSIARQCPAVGRVSEHELGPLDVGVTAFP